jgi:hypothetical protein
MDAKAFKKLVEQAKSDSQFFHDLVFSPEKVIGGLDYLDKKTKGAIVGMSPEEVIGAAITELAGCDVTCTSSCGATCAQSCGYTTNIVADSLGRVAGGRLGNMAELAGCDVTCTSSCGVTCSGSSCGYTTNLEDPGSLVSRRIRQR